MKILQKALVMVLVGLLLSAAAYAKGPTNHQLGPTGLQGAVSKATAKVTKVEKGSPADGKIKVGDQIIGAGNSKFVKDVRRELAEAIDAAETKTAGGKLPRMYRSDRTIRGSGDNVFA